MKTGIDSNFSNVHDAIVVIQGAITDENGKHL
jgi:hypothetical protein